MKNFTKMEFKLSSNVLKEIRDYANENDQNMCPTLYLKVKEIERDKGRYWLVLEEENGKEIWAMFSILLTQQILLQQLLTKPIIKLKHYYLHEFEAANFVDNPLETYINVIGVNEIEILEEKACRKEMKIQNNIEKLQMPPRRKRKRKAFELELETSEESDNDFKKKPGLKTKLKSVATVKKVVQPLENNNQNRNQVITDEFDDILKVTSIVQPSENKVSVERNNKLKIKSIVQPSENKVPDERNNKLKIKSIVQPSENKVPDERKDQSKAQNVQPSENKSLNIQPANIIPESFVGNGKTATLISSLTLTKNSPFIRAFIKISGAITVSARGCTYRRCRLKDSSGEVSCVIFDPICTTINNFLKVGAIIEIENAIVEGIPASMLAGSEKYKLNLCQSTTVALYNDITCVYEHPPKPSSVILPIINNSNIKYSLLQSIKNSIRSADRADAIGVLIWMSPILDVNHNNRRVKCRNLRIQDESTSVLVSLWELTAGSVNFPIGSVVSAKRARMKMVRDDLELVIDYRARISLAEDCEEKTRLQKWYQPAARRMIPKI